MKNVFTLAIVFASFTTTSYSQSACPSPGNLYVADLWGNVAKLIWDESPKAIGYNIMYKEVGAADWSSIYTETHHVALTGLKVSTKYLCMVEAVCDRSPLIISDRSGLLKFTTYPVRSASESLAQNSFKLYPNPANEEATLQFQLPQSSHVAVKLYAVNGTEILTSTDIDFEEGLHILDLNTKGLDHGIYIVKIVSDSGSDNQMLIVQ